MKTFQVPTDFILENIIEFFFKTVLKNFFLRTVFKIIPTQALRNIETNEQKDSQNEQKDANFHNQPEYEGT